MKEMQITSLAWGEMEVTVGGQKLHFKDCKLWPGGGREWNWGETGTHHNPGIQAVDIEEILAQGVEVLVLARGVFGRLGVCTETETLLRERGIPYHNERTKEAVRLFNQLAGEGKRVGGVFHSTC